MSVVHIITIIKNDICYTRTTYDLRKIVFKRVEISLKHKWGREPHVHLFHYAVGNVNLTHKTSLKKWLQSLSMAFGTSLYFENQLERHSRWKNKVRKWSRSMAKKWGKLMSSILEVNKNLGKIFSNFDPSQKCCL